MYYITNQIAVQDRSDATLIHDNNRTGDHRIELHAANRASPDADKRSERYAWLETNGGPRPIRSEEANGTWCSVAAAANALGLTARQLRGMLRKAKVPL